MTYEEMTRLCAEAMGIPVSLLGGRWRVNPYHNDEYSPLHDDAQAMALVKKLGISLNTTGNGVWCVSQSVSDVTHQMQAICLDEVTDLNLGIVTCVAKNMKAKEGSA